MSLPDHPSVPDTSLYRNFVSLIGFVSVILILSSCAPADHKTTAHGAVQRSRLIYTAGNDPNIHLLSPSGKGDERIKASGVDTEATVLPDGKQIAFHAYDHKNHTGGIYVMNVDGSHVRHLTNNPNDESPAFSPDGKEVLFKSIGKGQFPVDTIYAMRSNGKDRRKITEGQSPAGAGANEPSFFPDGRHIAYVATGPNGHYGDTIYSAKPDGSGRRQIVKLSRKGVYSLGGYDISPDGGKIVFSGQHATGPCPFCQMSEIYLINSDGSGLHRLTDKSLSPDGGVFSPDGRRIAFTGCDSNDHSCGIRVMSVEGGPVKKIQSKSINQPYYDLAWSKISGR